MPPNYYTLFLMLKCVCTHCYLFCVTISCLVEVCMFSQECEFTIILTIFILCCCASELPYQLSVMTSGDSSCEINIDRSAVYFTREMRKEFEGINCGRERHTDLSLRVFAENFVS